jgi:hypothetical protein
MYKLVIFWLEGGFTFYIILSMLHIYNKRAKTKMSLLFCESSR